MCEVVMSSQDHNRSMLQNGSNMVILYKCRECRKMLVFASKKEICDHLQRHGQKQRDDKPRRLRPPPKLKGMMWGTRRKIYDLFLQYPELHLTYQEAFNRCHTVKLNTVRYAMKNLREKGNWFLV